MLSRGHNDRETLVSYSKDESLYDEGRYLNASVMFPPPLSYDFLIVDYSRLLEAASGSIVRAVLSDDFDVMFTANTFDGIDLRGLGLWPRRATPTCWFRSKPAVSVLRKKPALRLVSKGSD